MHSGCNIIQAAKASIRIPSLIPLALLIYPAFLFKLQMLLIKFNIFNYFRNRNKKKQLTKTLLKSKRMPYLTSEKRAKIFTDFGGKAANTGSIEGQVALLTERINQISEHLKLNRKDFSSQRGLMKMVGQRKRLLTYLSKHNLTGYRALIEKLGLRK